MSEALQTQARVFGVVCDPARVSARLDAVAGIFAAVSPLFTRERRWERARAEVGILPTTTNQYDQQ